MPLCYLHIGNMDSGDQRGPKNWHDLPVSGCHAPRSPCHDLSALRPVLLAVPCHDPPGLPARSTRLPLAVLCHDLPVRCRLPWQIPVMLCLSRSLLLASGGHSTPATCPAGSPGLILYLS